MTKLDTVLIGATRMQNSVNGNPKWRCYTTHGDFITKTDSDVATIVANLMGSVQVPVKIILDRDNKIEGLTVERVEGRTRDTSKNGGSSSSH